MTNMPPKRHQFLCYAAIYLTFLLLSLGNNYSVEKKPKYLKSLLKFYYFNALANWRRLNVYGTALVHRSHYSPDTVRVRAWITKFTSEEALDENVFFRQI